MMMQAETKLDPIKGSGTPYHTSVDVKKGQSSNAELQLDAVTNCYHQIPSTVRVSKSLARCSSPTAQHGRSGNLPLRRR